MNDDNAKSLTFWLLILSLTVLIALSTTILIKNVLGEDKTQEVTTVKNVEVTRSVNTEPPMLISQDQTATVETPTVTEEPRENTETDPPDEISETPEPAPADTETPAPYTDEPEFENISYTYDYFVTGQVLGVNPAEYRVVLFIKVDGENYIKPSWAGAMTFIDDNGDFSIQAYTNDANRWSDQDATEYSVFCVPADFDLASMSSFSDLNAVREASALAAEGLPTGN
ncbi:MAG: hypothetical protein LBS84_03305 [Clostridiales bacterium]|jgi:hypothetical protein|nr:hypothetical protein [Clostridiales bacterium]